MRCSSYHTVVTTTLHLLNNSIRRISATGSCYKVVFKFSMFRNFLSCLQHCLMQQTTCDLMHVIADTAAAGAAAAAAPSEAEAKRRARFSLLRCDAYHCEREQVKNGMISFTNPATNQVMLVWEERPRRVLVLVKVYRARLALFFRHKIATAINNCLLVLVKAGCC
jgi:uncharacterized membrane protein